MWNEGKMSRLSQGDLFPVYILFFPDNTDNIIIIRKLYLILWTVRTACRVSRDQKFKKLLIELQEFTPKQVVFFLYHSVDVENKWINEDFYDLENRNFRWGTAPFQKVWVNFRKSELERNKRTNTPESQWTNSQMILVF